MFEKSDECILRENRILDCNYLFLRELFYTEFKINQAFNRKNSKLEFQTIEHSFRRCFK
jgi:hypothetical protein